MKLPKPQPEWVMEALTELKKPLIIVALLWGLSFLLLLATEVAKAEPRCDCTQVIDTCSATVSMSDMRVNIESDSESCSRVDYLIDGQPFAALVVGGSSAISWPGQPLRNPRIVVENCRVCAEAGDPNRAMKSKNMEAAPGGAGKVDEAAGAIGAIIKVMPAYPREAWTNLIEGIVTVEFEVNAGGVVENIRVVDATNQVFVNNSIDAVSRFRYSTATAGDEKSSGKKVREQFVFKLLGGTDPVVTSRTL
ncbi:MAG: TonB family protein [Gammaproteobacteria bacterium]|jgi:TonB family protein